MKPFEDFFEKLHSPRSSSSATLYLLSLTCSMKVQPRLFSTSCTSKLVCRR